MPRKVILRCDGLFPLFLCNFSFTPVALDRVLTTIFLYFHVNICFVLNRYFYFRETEMDKNCRKLFNPNCS